MRKRNPFPDLRYQIGIWWERRPESAEACAGRLANMFEDLQHCAPEFQCWYQVGMTMKEASVPLSITPPDIRALTSYVKRGVHRRDDNREVIPDLGFNLAGWNKIRGTKVLGLSASLGTYSLALSDKPNNVFIETESYEDSNADMFTFANFEPVFKAMIAAWDPLCGTVWPDGIVKRWYIDSYGHWPRFISGWMVYLSYPLRSRITPPASAILEEMPGGGLLMIATRDRFDLDNPEHIAVADAIQRSLEPLQKLSFASKSD